MSEYTSFYTLDNVYVVNLAYTTRWLKKQTKKKQQQQRNKQILLVHFEVATDGC